MTLSASASGQIRFGGQTIVNRLGFGAMRITGKGIWGEPADRPEAVRLLRRLRDLDVNFVDTADSYGPFTSEDLIAEALWPYDGMVIATKGGLTRQGPDAWQPVGRPEYLRQCVLMSLRRLKVEQIGLWQLHRIDSQVPSADQFGAVADMIREGLIKQAGLSQVSIKEIKAAQKVFPVATVQNLFNLEDRTSEDVLEYCASNDIAFIPWYPLGAGSLTKPGSALQALAAQRDATPSQIALAWMLKRSPAMLPIPGTSQLSHLEENVRAGAISLSDAEFSTLNAPVRKRR